MAGAVPGGVEGRGHLSVGVVVEEPVEQGEGGGVGLVELPGRGRDRDGEAPRLAALEPDVGGVTSVLSRVTSSTRRRIMRLRSRWGVDGSRHRAGKSAASALILALCSSFNAEAAAAARSQSSWAFAELARGVVPVGFEAVGDESVVRVDAEIAAPDQLGVVAGAPAPRGCDGAGRPPRPGSRPRPGR